MKGVRPDGPDELGVRASVGRHAKLGPDLAGERVDELHPERRLRRGTSREPSPTVPHAQGERLGAADELDGDPTPPVLGPTVLQGVRQQLVQHEPNGNREVDRDLDLLARELELRIGTEGVLERGRERSGIVREAHAREVTGRVELLVDERHRSDAIDRLVERHTCAGLYDVFRLQAK